MQKTRDPDLLIVGGGIFGLAVGLIAAEERHLNVELWRLDDTLRPEADTLRNLAWLHSGLAYTADNAPVEEKRLAGALRRGGQELIEYFGLEGAQRDRVKGIFCVNTERKQDFLFEAARLGIKEGDEDGEVAELTDAQLRRWVPADLRREEHSYYWVPDKPFDEAWVLSKARARATRRLRLRNWNKPVELLPDEETKWKVRTGHDRLCRPEKLLLAAGVRIPHLLQQLGLEAPNIKTYSAPLLCRRGSPWLENGLFHYWREGSTIINHGSRGAEFREIVGAYLCSDHDPDRCDERHVVERDVDTTIGRLPEPLQAQLRRPGAFTRTAAYKIGEPYPLLKGGGRRRCPQELWWQRSFERDGMPGVYAAFPGRATLAVTAARSCLELMYPLPQRRRRSAPVVDQDEYGKPFQWDAPILMHYDYDGLDERAEVVNA